MPHIIIDYSANLEAEIDMQAFCEHMRQAACEVEAFPMPGLRIRAIPAPHFAIADGDAQHGYVDISIRLRGGRPQDVKEAATQHMFAAAESYLAPLLARRSLALSMEMRDIDPALSPKTGTIRDHLKGA